MGRAVLFILGPRLLLYSVVCGLNRVQIVLSVYGVRLLYFVQAQTLCRYGCMYFFAVLMLVGVDVMVMSSV